ncbi:hypothetical protein BH18THE2_BH18THE2_31330 [soil metagenome]
MPVKIFKKFMGSKEEKDMSALEDRINQFEIQVEKGGMHIKNVTMSEVGQADDLFCMVHFGPKPSQEDQ